MTEKYSFSILLPFHSNRHIGAHGDYFFGNSLAEALKRKGHQTKLLAAQDWDQTAANDIALLIRGRATPTRPMGSLMLAWCISFLPKAAQNDFACIDHFFAASPFLVRRLSKSVGSEKVSLMYQAFDQQLMYPADVGAQNDLIFVGTPRSENRRPVVSFADQSGLPTRIWGNGWDDTSFAHLCAGGNVPNQELGDVYRSGSVILNDHLVVMKRNQLISNRVFDGLACGRAVLTDTRAGLPEELVPLVYEYWDAESFRDMAQTALAESPELRAERNAAATRMRSVHSFDQRATQICDQVREMLAKRS